MLSCAIDAIENRYMVVSDIPGAFIHADMEDKIHMLLEGTVTEMIIKLDPTIYKKHMWYNKHGKAMLYVQLKRPIWDTTSGSTVFETTVRDTTGMGIYIQPI